MEIKIKVQLGNPADINEFIEFIRKIEQEYSCNCTLVEIEIP